MAEDPTAGFAALVARSGPELPLDEACLLVAAHAHPGMDLAAQRARLDEMAAGVQRRTVDGVRDHLVELGFGGDRSDYHDPRNSLLPDVLDRRRGIPLTLAVVAIEVGRRAGVPLLGIGMPGHFLVRAADDEERFLDLFDGGAFLDRAACRVVFERLHTASPWDERFLEPVSAPVIVSRMLANLATSYRRSGDRRALSWAVGLRVHLPGVTEQDRRELGLLLGAAGRYADAAEVLEATGSERDRHAAQRLRARLN